jgi:hypothetical protein
VDRDLAVILRWEVEDVAAAAVDAV